MFFTIPFPAIDPVLIEIGPFAIRWYALAYIIGLLIGWRYCIWLAKQPPVRVTRTQLDDFLVWAILAIILGGRLGFVLFYQPGYYLEHPAQILQVWHGGMSFHGGLAGVLIAFFLFTRREKIPFFALADIVAAATPIGLFLGRLANFINGELWGRPSDAPWAMVFPNGGPLPRHPSQLYEAALEGVVLFVVLLFLARMPAVLARLGLVSGVFLTGYALSRIIVEFFREPDREVGYLIGGTTMGQWLSVPMLIAGICIILYACLKHPRPAT
jgi:phosphatidylglycerol---prolipoprotein diacylglyceryl transferase